MIDSRHGAHSVEHHFDKFDVLWNKYGLTTSERELIKQAVIQHSTNEWTKLEEDGYDVMAILKDADALDRCRIGDLNPTYLRYLESRELAGIIRSIFLMTCNVNDDMTLPEFISGLK